MSEMEEVLADVRTAAAEMLSPMTTGPELYYVTSDGKRVVPITHTLVKDQFDGEITAEGHLEQLICRALITHALALMDGEDVA